MGSRIVLPFGPNDEYIGKYIPNDTSLEGIHFPSLDDYMETNKLDLNSIIKPELKTAIEQQYNEWFTWYTSSEECRRMLAPIVDTGYDEYCLPILYFPKFIPLVDENAVYKYNNMENFIVMGMGLKKFHVLEEEIINFMRNIPSLCDCLELNEEDILNNPSNICFHPIFGLRIIDYGLLQ